MATLPGLDKGVFQDPSPPLVDSQLSPITIPNGTTLVTTKTTNETIDNVNQLIDYVSGDAGPNFIPQAAIENLVSDLSLRELLVNKVTTIGTPGNDTNYGTEKAVRDALNLKEDSLGFTPEDTANKGAVSGYAGLDASQELLLTNFPSGVSLQVLRRNAANDALEFATLSDLQGITSINADTTAAQLIVGTTNVITVGTAAGTTTIDIDSAYVGQTSITTLGTITTGVWNGTAITGANINAASTDLTDTGVIVRTDQANTWTTGLQNFAAVTLRIPVSATPSVTVDGDIAYDTTVDDFSTGLIKFFGIEEQGIVSMPISQFTTPSDGFVVTYNATNDEFELVAAPGGGTGTLRLVKLEGVTISTDREGLNFVDTSTINFTVTDDAGNDEADVIAAIVNDSVVDAQIGTHTSSKITITTKSQLNSEIVYNDQANVFGNFIQTFKDNSITIESPDGLTPTTLVNAQQTLARNLTIPILTADRTIVVTGETSQITLGTEVTGAITDLSDVTAKTGTGTIAVFDTSPTIVTPTIASFVNAGHDHLNAIGGGTLTAAAISNFDTSVSANADVTANTDKVTNATHTGDAIGDVALTIANDAVTYAKMQNVVSDDVLLGNIAGAGGIVTELTGTQVNTILPVFTDALNGLVPSSGGGTTNFLRADGTFAVPVDTAGITTLNSDTAAVQTLTGGDGIDITDATPDHSFAVDATVVRTNQVNTYTGGGAQSFGSADLLDVNDIGDNVNPVTDIYLFTGLNVSKIFFDGTEGSNDTFITGSGATGRINFVSDGTLVLSTTTTGIIVNGAVNFLDFDTTIQQSGINLQLDVATGGVFDFRETNSTIATLNATSFNLVSGITFQENSVNISPIGIHDIGLPATAFFLPTFEPASPLTNINFATNDIDKKVFEFTSTTADERIQTTIYLPRNWNNGNVSMEFYWSFSAGTGDVRWAVRFGATGNNEALDNAFAAATATNDTAGTANQLQKVVLSGIVMPAGIGSGDEIQIEIFREGSNAGDTFTGTARLHGVVLMITTDAAVAA